MKKITIITEDDVDLRELIAAATPVSVDLKMETIVSNGKTPHRRRRYIKGMTAPDAVMSHYTHGAHFTAVDADRWARDVGFGPATGSSTLAKLERDGYIKRVDGKKKNVTWQFAKPMKKETAHAGA